MNRRPAMPGAASTADLVREATASKGGAGSRGRSDTFGLDRAGPSERWIPPFLGLYLVYAVVRLAEVFPVLEIPKLQMIMMAVFLTTLVVFIPPTGWRVIWDASMPLRLVTILFGISIVTIPLGIYMMGSLEFVRERYVVAVMVFFTCTVLLRDRRSFRTALTVFVIGVAVVAAYALLTYDITQYAFDRYGNPIPVEDVNLEQIRIRVGASLDANDWGAVLASTAPLALWLSIGSFTRRIIFLPITALLIIAVVPTGSRGTFLGLVAGAMVLITVGTKGWNRILTLSLITIAGVGFATVATSGHLERFLDFGPDDYNLTNEGRWYFWRQGFVWMIKRPWGYGIGNFGTYFGWLNGPDRAAHSMWVQYGMELGVAGLVAIVALVRSLVKGLNRLRHRIGSGSAVDRADAILAGHMLAALAGMLVTGSFLSNAYYPLTYMILGLASAALLGRTNAVAPLQPEPRPDPTPRPGRRVRVSPMSRR